MQSIHKGQVEAGLALGLHKRAIFRHIILRPALRAVFPSLTGQFIMLMLTTSIASAIAAYELTSVARLIESATFRSFEVYGTITLALFRHVRSPSCRASRRSAATTSATR